MLVDWPATIALIVAVWFGVGIVSAIAHYKLERSDEGGWIGIAIYMIVYSAFGPLTTLIVGDLVFKRLRRRSMQIPPLSARLDQIDRYLIELPEHEKISEFQIAALQDSYKWIRQKGHSEHELFRVEDLDVLGESSVYEKSEAGRKRDRDIANANPHVMHMMIRYCRVWLSNRFEQSFCMLEASKGKSLIAELKAIAADTGDRGSHPDNEVASLRRIKMNGPLPCIVVAPNVVLVVEPKMEYEGTYFSGLTFMGMLATRAVTTV